MSLAVPDLGIAPVKISGQSCLLLMDTHSGSGERVTCPSNLAALKLPVLTVYLHSTHNSGQKSKQQHMCVAYVLAHTSIKQVEI